MCSGLFVLIANPRAVGQSACDTLKPLTVRIEGNSAEGARAEGAGVILASDARTVWIGTSGHVVAGLENIDVLFWDSQKVKVPARVEFRRRAEENVMDDIAFLRVNRVPRAPPPPFPLRSDPVANGERVSYAGHPGELTWQCYPNNQVISREEYPDNNDIFLFTNPGPAIPGLSGGPVSDAAGNLLGIIYGQISGNAIAVKIQVVLRLLSKELGVSPSPSVIVPTRTPPEQTKSGTDDGEQSHFGRSTNPNSLALSNKPSVDININYVRVKPGTFMMGCSPGDGQCFDAEKPQHSVVITKEFWIASTLTTVAAWNLQRFRMGRIPILMTTDTFGRRNLNQGQDMPVVGVTWNAAQTFCAQAGGRLPTEAEWEFAARAGNAGIRYGELDAIAWYADNSGDQRLDSVRMPSNGFGQALANNGNGPHGVRQKEPNRLGLYDMLGNVWEWTSDWYGANFYKQSPRYDPKGPLTGTLRIIRGGSWQDEPQAVRLSARFWREPSIVNDSIGFRCVTDSPR